MQNMDTKVYPVRDAVVSPKCSPCCLCDELMFCVWRTSVADAATTSIDHEIHIVAILCARMTSSMCLVIRSYVGQVLHY